MLVSDSARFLFVHIPKTAGSSLSYHLRPYIEERYRQPNTEVFDDGPGWQPTWHFHRGQHHQAEEALSRLADDGLLEGVRRHRLCTFVRDPYEWIVSVWMNFREMPGTNIGAAFAEEFPNDRTFPNFLELVSKLNDPGLWGTQSQLAFVRNSYGIETDFIGRFEELHADCARMFEHLGLPVPEEMIHKVNHGPPGRHDLAALYETTENVQRVEQLFAEDFETFEYPHREIL